MKDLGDFRLDFIMGLTKAIDDTAQRGFVNANELGKPVLPNSRAPYLKLEVRIQGGFLR